MNRLILSQSFDPWHNLAVEEALFDLHGSGVTLYLWQNDNTVVIGRNQNAWKECRVDALSHDGGRLARRTSGGGAVFHDLGNLNFTFIADAKLYDVSRQLSVIVRACKSLGIDAEFTGRNDIVTRTGAKFSGNAFRKTKTTGMHHGTLLISADMTKLSSYLMPSKEKLHAKGVDSVRSRVINLTEIKSDLTADMMKAALISAFEAGYGAYSLMDEGELDKSVLDALTARHASWEWRMGVTPHFDIELSTRFSWGEVQLHLDLDGGVISAVRAYSDAMDEQLIASIPAVLTGVRFSSPDMAHAVSALGTDEARDISNWINLKGF